MCVCVALCRAMVNGQFYKLHEPSVWFCCTLYRCIFSRQWGNGCLYMRTSFYCLHYCILACMACVAQFEVTDRFICPFVLLFICCRIEKQLSRFRGWLPKKPMRLDKERMPDLEENDCYTAPFSQQRIHQ